MIDEKQNHESYGLIGISNTSYSGGTALFGSSIKHSQTITLRIKKASVERKYHQEWYFGKEKLIEIEISAAQFAQFITTPNFGDGVPCTIRGFNGKSLKRPPYVGHNEVFNKELKEDFQKALKDSDSLLKDSEEILNSKGQMKVADKKKLLGKIRKLTQHVKDNMPFLHTQFTRAMDKTVTVAKAEIENYYTNTVMKLGVKALKDKKAIDLLTMENSIKE